MLPGSAAGMAAATIQVTGQHGNPAIPDRGAGIVADPGNLPT